MNCIEQQELLLLFLEAGRWNEEEENAFICIRDRLNLKTLKIGIFLRNAKAKVAVCDNFYSLEFQTFVSKINVHQNCSQVPKIILVSA